MPTTISIPSEATIWTRLIQPKNGSLSQAAARALLAINFTDEDKARMHELAQKNAEGLLSPTEHQELEGYVKVGDILCLLHLKARKSLNG